MKSEKYTNSEKSKHTQGRKKGLIFTHFHTK